MRHISTIVTIASIICIALVSTNPLQGQYTHTVLPIGNFGDISQVATFARAIGHLLDSLGGNQTLLFTGDLSDSRHNLQHTTNRIDTLLSILDTAPNRKIVFIPGDRDWANSGMLGWEQLNLLEKYVRSLERDDVLWPLRNGCPGPEKLELDLALYLVVINTQWWNHPYQKPTPESALCEIATHEEALGEIETIIEETRYGNILIAGHYPIISGGVYGGHFPFSDWLLPAPVISTMVTAHRQNVGSPREICNERYSEFREDMEDILSEYPSLIYVSGHEHNREMLNFKDNILLQTGAPEKTGFVSRSSSTRYSSRTPGLVALHYDMEGNAWASMYDLGRAGYQFEKRIKLLQAPCRTPMAGVSINQRLVPCLDDQYVLPQMEHEVQGNTIVAANPKFAASGFKKLMLGEHYRKSWTTPVEVPYLDLDRYADGLVPYLEGGGRQTKSLRLAGENGREYVFRSVDKDPSKALSYNLRESLISLLVRDQITTQHPYGALVASRLLDRLGILHSTPQLVVIPDDAKLGPFQATFGNMLGMIEERPTGRKEVHQTFAGADEVLGSTEMFRELYKDCDRLIDKQEYARARVFDMFAGDWGKHEDNWRWAGYTGDTETVYRPIPRDRDHVFSRWDGFLPWLVDREWAKPSGEDFDYKINGIRSLMWQARHLDRFLANELTREDWIEAADFLQANISKADIDSSILAFPPEVRNFNGDEIAAKLEKRLGDLDEYAVRYSNILAKQVDVPGSNKTELFEAVRNADGTMDVSMYKLRQGIKDKLFYQRRFNPDETKEVRLFGLQGDDVIHVTGDSRKSILLRIVPGAGINEVVDSSHVDRGTDATRVYSLNGTDHISGGAETKEVHIPYQEAYQYRRTAFTYNTYMPLIYVWSSSGNGIVFGGGVTFTRQSYDKPDFSAIHQVSASVSTLGNFRLGYEGKSRHVLGMWDLTYGILLDKHRRLNYFFGTGNNTVLDHDLLLDDYYTLQYSSLQVSTGLSRSFWDRSSLGFGLIFKGTGKENLDGNIFDISTYPDVAGHERLRIAKGYVACDLDFRDRVHLPQRGMRLAIEGIAAKALNDATNYANVKASLEYFVTARPFTLGLKIGGVTHQGMTPFYDLHYLGQKSNLRGFRQNRFTGETLAFLNTDLRIQLINNPRALIPYKLGITLFFDSGRVFESLEAANDVGWHQGYGAGIYFVPLRDRFAIQLSMGFSKEESGLIRFGFGQAF